MFMDWTKQDKEDLKDLVQGLRLFMGVPTMLTMIIFSLETLTKNKYELPWNPVTFLISLGLALAIKLIEIIIHAICQR